MTNRLGVLSMLFLCCVYGNAQQNIVTDVKIQGAKRTNAAFLKNLVGLKPGLALDSLMMAEDMTRLKRLPSISHAHFQVFSSEEGGHNVYYTVEENFTLIPYANLFSSSDDDFAFRIGLQEFNLFGRNITLGGFYQYDNFSSYGVSVRAPYLFTPQIGLAVNYNNFSTQEPVFFNNTTADYRYSNKGFEVLGVYGFDFRNRVELGGSLFTENYEYLFGATSPNVPQQLNVDKHLVKFLYTFENVRYHYQYLEGFRSALNLQYVGSSDETLPEFVIGFNDFIYFRRMGSSGNWASRLRLGLATNIDTPFAPFTVDNNLNIRGVGNTIDRGTGALVLNTEYRHTLVDKNWFVLQGNVFVDGGSWRNPGGDFGDFGDDRNIRIYPGIGLRFMHKRIFNAIFRIDYGYGITKDASHGLVFGIGQYF